ncbi:MAG: S41 family peptidase [Bacillota bacterium]
MIKRRNKVLKTLFLLILFLSIIPGALVYADQAVPLEEIKELIRENYAGEFSEQVLDADTVEKLFVELGDLHSTYMSPKEFEDFKIASSQEYAGVGMQLVLKGDYLEVTVVFPNTPAERAGVKPGDLVYSIDGESMKGLSQDEIVNLIRGPAGTTVLIGFLREGHDEVLLFSMTRANIHLEVLESQMLEPGIGYISLSNFTPTSGAEFRQMLFDLKFNGAKGLVFDLRQNGGGYLTAALDIGSLFVGIGDPLLHVVDGDGDKTTYQSLTVAIGLPTVVLVDEDSASASEIVAGIIRDSGAGWLVGNTTFGKASVQTLFPLSDGGAVKLTTARYLTPSEYDLNGVGLVPDKIVEAKDQQLAGALAFLKEELAKMPAKYAGVFQLSPQGVFWNGEQVALDPAPFYEGGHFMMPIRSVGEIFSLNIYWDETKNQVRASNEERIILLTPGVKEVSFNGQVQPLSTAPVINNERMYLSARALAELLEAELEYDESTNTVTIIKK